MKKTILFTRVPKIKYREVNFTREVQGVYIESYKILLKEMNKDIIRRHEHLWIGREYYQDGSTTQSDLQIQCVNPYQNPSGLFFFFVEMEMVIQKFIWNCKESHIAKTIMNKNKIGELQFPDFKTYGNKS